MKLSIFDLLPDSDILIRSVIGRVAAGQPVELVGEEELMDLNYWVSRGSQNTRVILVEGDSMAPEISDGDFVVIACDKQPKPNDIVIARIGGGLTVKRFKLNHGHRRGLYLVPTNDSYKPREVVPADNLEIVGVVTYILKKAA